MLHDAVDAEGPHSLALIAKSAQIIVVTIPFQCIGTYRVWRTVIGRITLLIHIIVRVDEPDFSVAINRFMDGIHNVIPLLVLRLGASGYIDMPAKLRSIRCTGQREKLGNQFVALTLRDKPGGRNRIYKELKLSQVIHVTIIVIFVLCRLVVLNVKATIVKNGKIITDCVPGNVDSILLFQNLHQFSCREWMLCIGVLKEVLV